MSATLVRRHSRLLFIAVSAALASGTVSAQSSRASAATLDEVVVSAQKRDENLQEVPVSITAFSGEQLHELQINSGTEIARQTPNLRVSNLGNEDQPKFSMRGIATPDFNLNTASPTGIFYDEVYVASQFLGGPQIFDLERIEVLRGPQGTLFGKNTTGGAINFITHAPTPKSEGFVSVETGSNNYFHAQGALNMPLVDDKLATRLAFNTSKSDGWIKNYNPAGHDLSSINNYALRWSFLYEPTDNFDANLRLLHSRSNPTNIGVIAYGTAPCAGGGNNCNAFGVNPRKNPANGQDFNAWEGYYDRVGGEIKADGDGGILTLNEKMGDLKLTSITSYMKGDFKNNVDADGSIASLIHIDFYAQTKEIGQDLRLSSQYDGAFNFIAGLYYFHDTTAIQTNYFMFAGGFNPAQSYNQSRTSYAAYADMTYDFTPTWTAYGGVRWTDDHGEINDFKVVVAPATLTAPPAQYDDSAPTGRLGIRHKFSDDLMGYAQYARGYRSSTFNGSALSPADFNVADPEYLDSFELGLKSQLLERRLQVNSSVFYYKYTDQQFVNAITLAQSRMVNAGKASLYGLELEAVAQITEGLRATAGLALLHTNYDELSLSRNPVAGQVCPNPTPGTTLCTYNLAGNELIEAPHASFNLALDYSLPVAGGHIGFHADGVYMTSMYYTPWNDLPPSNMSVTPSQWEANARIGYRPTEGNFEIAVWGKNLNGNDVAAGQVGADQSTFYQRFTVSPYPLRYGLEFNYHF